MKKDILKKIALGSLAAICCTGMFTACGNNDGDKENSSYTLVFDEDNDSSTKNVVKKIDKKDLNDQTNWPVLEDENGYARQWVLKGWKNDTATLIAKGGNGTQENPYLISTEEHFKKMADSVSALTSSEEVDYYQGDTKVPSSDTYDKVVKTTGYATVNVVSAEKSGVKTWTYETSKQYFRLINDIVFDSQVITATGYSSFVLDGAKTNVFTNDNEGNYKLSNVNPTNFPSGYIFNIIVDTTIKNLDVSLADSVVGLAFYTSGGVYNEGARRDTTKFENITIDSNGAPINQQGTNKSAFISHVMHDASFDITNCTMDVTKINSTSSWSGIFVGGYPKTDGKVTFRNCVNNADVTTTGSIGIFFGNDTYKTNTIVQNIHEVINCTNNGVIIGNKKSHVLVPFENTGNQTETHYTEAETKVLDAEGGVDGKFINNGSFIALDASEAQISDYNIIIPSTFLTSLQDGKTYSIVVTVENALHKLESELVDKKIYSSLTTNIPISYTLTVDGAVTTNFVMQDIYCSVLDVTKYCDEYGVNPQSIEWTDAGSCEYYLDKTNHCYVINTTEYFSVMKTGTSYGNNVRFSIVIKDGDEIVSFFSVTPKENTL